MFRLLKFALLLAFVSASISTQAQVVPGQANVKTDKYGGLLGYPCVGGSGATGYFYTYKDTGLQRWLLCDPDGYRFLFLGVEVVDYGNGPYVGIANAKYGAFGTATGWEAIQTRRLQSMGFNVIAEDAGTHFWYPQGHNPNPIPFVYIIAPSLYASAGTKDVYANVPPKWDSYGGYRGFRSFDLWDPIWTSLGTGPDGSLCTAGLCDCMTAFGITCAAVDASPWLLNTGIGDVAFVGQVYTNQSTYVVGITAPYEQYENSVGYARQQVFSTPTMYIKQHWSDWLCGTRYANLAALNTAWGSSYSTCGSSATTAASETIGTGNGVLTSFSYTFLHGPVDPASIGIRVGGVLQGGDCPWWNSGCITTAGKGTPQAASGLGSAINGGTVSYRSDGVACGGQAAPCITVTFSVAPANGVAITATYQYLGWPKALMVSTTYNQLASDNFTRANANPIGGNWTTAPSTQNIKIASNLAAPTTNAAYDVAYYNAVSWPNDQYSAITVNTLPNTSDTGLAIIRASSSVESFYECSVLGVLGGVVNIRIDKVILGATSNVTSGTATVNAGDIVRCEAQGTNLTFKLNDVVKLTSTDSSLASGNAGIGFFSATTPTFSNWTGGSITTNQLGGTGLLDEDGTSSWWPAGDPESRVDFPDPPVGTIPSDMDVFLNLTVAQYAKPCHDWLKSNFPHHMAASTNQAGAGFRTQSYRALAANADMLLYSNSLSADYNIIMADAAWQTSAIAQYNAVPIPVYVGVYTNASPDSQYTGDVCQLVPRLCFATQNAKGQFYGDMADAAWSIKGADGYSFILGLDYWQYTDNSSEQGAYGLVSLNDNAYDGIETVQQSTVDPFGFKTTGETPVSQTGYAIGTGNGSSVTFNQTIKLLPIKPGTFSVTAGAVTCSDNSNGSLTGAGCASGTIQYANPGAISVTFSSAPGNAVPITAAFTQNGFGGYQPSFVPTIRLQNARAQLQLASGSYSILSTNLALEKPAMFTSATETLAATQFQHANDGDITTSWQPTATNPQAYRVDLVGLPSVSKIILRWGAVYATAYTLDWSDDGLSWTTAFTQAAGAGGVETDTFTAVSHRYWRGNFTARSGAGSLILQEMEILAQ